MEKNGYIEQLLILGDFPYVIWNKNEEDKEGDGSIPLSIYSFLAAFYQTLDYEEILKKNAICQVESALGLCNLLIPGEGKIYVMGPYRTESVSIAEFFSYLINNNLPITQEFSLFYHSLPLYEKERMNALRKLLGMAIQTTGFREIHQKRSFPSEDHLHSQFYYWNNSEKAFATLIETEEELLSGFYAENSVLSAEVAAKVFSTLKNTEHIFELHFLKEHLHVSNGTYQRLCYMKTKRWNEITSIFYRFKTEIEALTRQEEAFVLMQKMYEAYCGLTSSFSYEEYPYLVQQAIRYMNTHWREKITLTQIADALSVNDTYLSSVFNQATNKKITDYIHQLRTDWAEILLQSTTLGVTDISFLCGYEDVSYFGKVYRKMKGETPSQARIHSKK